MGRHEVLPKWAQLGKEPPRHKRESAEAPAPRRVSDQERAFELVTVGGMPAYEVAAALDVSPAEVKDMVRRQAASDEAFLRRFLVAAGKD